MVSADGTSVTPDDSDPQGENPIEKRDSMVSMEKGADAPADEAASEESQPETTGESSDDVQKLSPASESPRPRKKKKPSRKQRRISRLVMEFQPDAVEMEHRKVAGGLRWTLYTVISLLAATVAWAWWAEVDRVVTAEGKLIATEYFIIKAPSAAPIRKIEVEFGDTVKAGQILATFDPTFSEADVSKLESRSNNYLAMLTRLEAEQNEKELSIAGHEHDTVWITQQMLFLDRRRKTSAMLAEFEAEHRKLVAQKARNEADVKSRHDLIEHRTQVLKQSTELLEKQAGTRNDVMRDQAELKYAQSQLLTAESTVKETVAQFDVLAKQRESRLAEQKAAVSLELAETRQLYKEVQDDLTKARFSNTMVVLEAPDNYPEYKVVEISDTSSVVMGGDPIMRLIPVNTILELEVKVDSKDIALIRDSLDGKAKKVRIKVSAYPYMKHGTLDGIVKTINEDITEEGQPGMMRSYYVVRVAIDRGDEAPGLRNVPDGNDQLRPGMSATAEIKVGRRKVLYYFIYPLFRSLDNSIREP